MKDKLLKIEKTILEIPQKIASLYGNIVNHLLTIASKSRDLGKTNFELGLFHLDQGNLNDAIMRFIFTTKLKKDFAPAHYHLARCYLIKGAYAKAETELKEALFIDPSFTMAKYRLDMLNDLFEDSYIPTEIIKEDFNTLASTYENKMLNILGYQAPDDLANSIAFAIENKKITEKEKFNCIDLGCGTGLMGGALAEKVAVKSLIGIDISIKMLQLAKELEFNQIPVYTETAKGNFNNLEFSDRKFDIITSCLSFCYDKDLTKVFSSLDSISINGTILGLVFPKSELSTESRFNYKYGCFEYSNNYLKSIFEKYNWSIVEEKEIALFFDNTDGYIFVLVKK